MIEEYYKDGTIDDPTAREELRKRQYPAYAIEWMIADWDQQMVVAAREEAERAQKEQERIAKAEFSTARAKALADLNAQIAEVNLYIAELKVALFYATTDKEKETINENILLAKQQIAELQLEKAQVPVVPTE
jgi:hypothetical protein